MVSGFGSMLLVLLGVGGGLVFSGWGCWCLVVDVLLCFLGLVCGG